MTGRQFDISTVTIVRRIKGMDVLSQHFTKSKLLKYTLPTMAMMFVSSAYGIIDGLFVSNLVGKDALASMTIVLPFTVILSALGVMMGSGGSAVVGQLLGAGDGKGANRAFSLIAWTTFIVGVVCSVLGIAFMDEVVVLLGASAEMAPMAATYGKIVFLCLPMFMLTYVFEMFCSVAGKPGFGFLSSLTAGVVNIGLDAVLMGVFGMGIEGAATATCIAEYASATLMVVLFARGKVGVLKLVRPRWVHGVLPRSIVNGVSEMVGCAAMSVVAAAYNLQLMNLFGPDGVAAYAVIEYASMLIGAALGGLTEGMAPLMSYQHGAGNNYEKRSLFGNGATLTAAMGVGAFLVAQLLAQPLAFAFTGYDGALMALTIHAFRMYSIAFLLMGVTYFGSVMFTAVENGKISALISFVHTFVFELGSVILLPVIFGADSIWWSIIVAEAAASILTIGLVARHAKGYGWR